MKSTRTLLSACLLTMFIAAGTHAQQGASPGLVTVLDVAKVFENHPVFKAKMDSLKQEGTLVTLGPTEGSTHVFGIFEAEELSTVQDLIHADIYWTQGIWTQVEVYPWIQAF